MENKDITRYEMNEVTVNNEDVVRRERMDINNPVTIYSYGSGVLADYKTISEQIPASFANSDYRDYEFTDPINVIRRFNDSLNGEEKNNNSMLKKSKFASGLANVLNRITRGNVDILGVNTTYQNDFKEYIDAVRDLSIQMAKDKASLLDDCNEFTEFKSYIESVIAELESVIKLGWEDVEGFESELDEFKVAKPELYKARVMFVNMAKERLTSLASSKTLMNSLVGQIDLAHASAGVQIMKYEEFGQVTAPSMALYSKLAVRIKRDARRIDRMREVKKETNETIMASANKLTENIGAVMELGEDSIISLETLRETVEQFRAGADMVEKFHSEKARNRGNVLATLNELDATVDRYKDILSQGDYIIEASESSLPSGSYGSRSSHTRRLGSRYGK